MRHGRQLVAAIELVSPSNKDRAENRRAFVAKVAALLQKSVCVAIVDLVTIRHANLYVEVLDFIGRSDPQLQSAIPDIYAVTLNGRRAESRLSQRRKSLLDLWHYPLAIGSPLPTLPIWLNADLQVMLPLETCYEETCQLLHIQ